MAAVRDMLHAQRTEATATEVGLQLPGLLVDRWPDLSRHTDQLHRSVDYLRTGAGDHPRSWPHQYRVWRHSYLVSTCLHHQPGPFWKALRSRGHQTRLRLFQCLGPLPPWRTRSRAVWPASASFVLFWDLVRQETGRALPRPWPSGFPFASGLLGWPSSIAEPLLVPWLRHR